MAAESHQHVFIASRDGSVAYPRAPWRLQGQLFLSVLHLSEPAGPLRPAGLWTVAFVRYEEPSPLAYAELLVARAHRVGRSRVPHVSVSDIWVDCPASAAGGRELWAIPKQLCDFSMESVHRGPLTSTDWSAAIGRRPIAEAHVTDVSRVAPRVPFRARLWQPGIPDTDGAERYASIRGTGRPLPCRASWDFAADGPLGWLRPARPLASARVAGFRMSFG